MKHFREQEQEQEREQAFAWILCLAAQNMMQKRGENPPNVPKTVIFDPK